MIQRKSPLEFFANTNARAISSVPELSFTAHFVNHVRGENLFDRPANPGDLQNEAATARIIDDSLAPEREFE